MKLTWLGHSGFRVEIADQVLLIDPWLTGNPMFEGQDRAAAIAGATAILITHAHFDHAGEAVALSRETGAPLVGIFDLMEYWETTEKVKTVKFHKGGTVELGSVAVTLVNAVHSSTLDGPDGFKVAGSEAGFMIAGEGHTIYVSGDTDVTADMGIFEALHQPDIGILCVGGHFTMDQRRAAYAAKTFFNFKTIVPCHYKTFPMLAQDVEELKAALPEIEILELEVMRPHDIA
ncbi:MAG: metal-dependent hydrolase [Pseudomonadota bacterium]